jgi:hypothetical protein
MGKGLMQGQRKQIKKGVALTTPFAIVGVDSARVAPQQSSILWPLVEILIDKVRNINRGIFDQKCNNFLVKNVLDMGSTILHQLHVELTLHKMLCS